MHVLTLLREMGLDPECEPARQMTRRVEAHVTWAGCGPDECAQNPFFAGETEPCINGQVAALGAYFGADVTALINRLLAEQLPDGGWNCEAERGSTKSSFNTTICVLEALLEWELRRGPVARVSDARRRGEAYLLERQLFRRRSTGAAIDDRKAKVPFTTVAFPTWWHYDILRALDYLRRAGVAPDARVSDAIEHVASKRGPDGRWPLETQYPGRMLVTLDDGVGQPSRWITLRALRVLAWYDAREERRRHISAIG
jgi:hypothetical protein